MDAYDFYQFNVESELPSHFLTLVNIILLFISNAKVESGVKYGANAWIHLYDFRKPNLWGCTGSFDQLRD